MTILQRRVISFSVIFLALAFIVIQLSSFSVDASLSDWQQGAEGYVKSSQLNRETKQPVALFFYTDWCSSCEKLRKDVLATQAVKQFMTTLHPVKVNPEHGMLDHQLAEDFGVIGYPSFFLVDTQTGHARTIQRTSNITPEQFIAQLQEARSLLAQASL